MNDTPTMGATMGRVLTIAAVAAAMLLALPAVAGAQGDAPYPPRITVENPAVTVVIEGSDWRPGTEVTIIRRTGTTQSASAGSTEVLTVAQADRSGRFSTEVAVPRGTEMHLQASGVDGSGEDRVQGYVATADPPEVTRTELAQSGLTRWQALAGGALVLIMLGTVSAALVRRRATVPVSTD